MFPERYFPATYFAPRYWSEVGAELPVVVEEVAARRGGVWRREEEERNEERLQREKRERRDRLETSIRRAYESHFPTREPEPEQVEEIVERVVKQPAFSDVTLEYLLASMQLDAAVGDALATISWQLADEEDAEALMIMETV